MEDGVLVLTFPNHESGVKVEKVTVSWAQVELVIYGIVTGVPSFFHFDNLLVVVALCLPIHDLQLSVAPWFHCVSHDP